MFSKDHVHNEVKAMVADLQLGDKSNVQAGHLSGGMKRKLRYIHMHMASSFNSTCDAVLP